MRPKIKVYEDFETDVNYQYLLFLLLLLLFWPQILLVKRESDIFLCNTGSNSLTVISSFYSMSLPPVD